MKVMASSVRWLQIGGLLTDGNEFLQNSTIKWFLFVVFLVHFVGPQVRIYYQKAFFFTNTNFFSINAKQCGKSNGGVTFHHMFSFFQILQLPRTCTHIPVCVPVYRNNLVDKIWSVAVKASMGMWML